MCHQWTVFCGRDRRYPIVNKFSDPGTPLPVPDTAVTAGMKAETKAFDL